MCIGSNRQSVTAVLSDYVMRLHAHVPYVCVRGGGAYVFICAYAQNNTVMQTSDPCNTRVVV